jgi:methylenetetrahydrofolate reductase (NADPH)
VPGAVVTDDLLRTVQREWQDKRQGKKAAIERAARLGAVLRGLGYRGIHIGGIHRDFESVGRILDRMEAIKDDWQAFLPEFDHPQPGGFYALEKPLSKAAKAPAFGRAPRSPALLEKIHYALLQKAHRSFFNTGARLAPVYRSICKALDSSQTGRNTLNLLEHAVKKLLLGCQQCGDCAIQHVGFLCPESGCPKHTRNGACGGSNRGMCEVNPDRTCVWMRAHNRLAYQNKIGDLCDGCVPPRMWELNGTSSWLNFHLNRDHHSSGTEIAAFCRQATCRLLY